MAGLKYPPNMRIFCTLAILAPSLLAQDAIPQTIADSVGDTLRYAEGQFLTIVEAMPEAKFSFVPSVGNFADARSFAEQVKHVACAQFAFFNEIEGKTPPEACERGGPSSASTKAELIRYLRDSFDYGNRVLATINSQNALERVEGRYAGPSTRLGMAVTAVWHVTDHYGQIVEYLRMNGIVPPSMQKYGVKVR
ncbi:MAG: DinB family protein [Bryobacteraceae bacterium]|jgi:uncharacterized damage-inducible protein DinB